MEFIPDIKKSEIVRFVFGNCRTFSEFFENVRKFKKNKSDILHIQALKNINMKINEGDRVGIYGNNGSGKSSLLKVISGIYYPSNGSINVEGRINSLISLNAGFNENLTGKENSIFKLKLLGLKKDENQFLQFHKNGEGISLFGKGKSQLLFLSGTPFNEKVASWGPYVMNTQKEIMEALRDYQQGKMGFLPV